MAKKAPKPGCLEADRTAHKHKAQTTSTDTNTQLKEVSADNKGAWQDKGKAVELQMIQPHTAQVASARH